MKPNKAHVDKPANRKPNKPAVNATHSETGIPGVGSGRQSAKETIKGSEIRYRRLFESAEDGILILNASTGVVIDVNPFLTKMLGFSKAEICGKELWELGFFKDIAENKANFKELQQEKSIRYEDLPLETAGGSKFRVEFVSNIYQEGDHKVIQCNFRDITERSRTKDALKESEEKYRNLVNRISEGILVTDAGGIFTFANPAFAHILGYESPQAIVGRNFTEFIAPSMLDELVKYFDQAVKTGKFRGQAIVELLHTDGRNRIIEINSTAIMEGTHVVGTHSLARDITENQQIQTLQQAVYRIAAAAESTRSLEELYPQIHQIISSVMPAENFYITLYEEAENLLRFPYYKDSVDPLVEGAVQPVRGLSAYVLRTGKSLLCTQAVHDELERLGEIELLGAPSAIWLGVPLLFAGKTIGVMVVQHYTDPQAYGEREQRMLEYVSTQVAIAIDRKRAEEQVIASELRYRRLFEAARDGILILDAETGVVKDVNPFLVEMLGIRAEEIIGKELWELGFFKDIASNKANFLELQQKGYIRYEDLPLETRGGRKFQVEFVSNVYQVNHHKVVQCNIRDITERKRAAETLQKSEKRFRSLMEHSLEEISLIDSHGVLTWESPTIRRPLGYPPNSFMGQSLIDLIHPDERRAATRLLEKIQLHPGRVREGVFRVRHHDGSWRWMEAVFSNLLDEPAVQSLVINYRDVTERKRAEKALQESEERYRLLVETLPEGVIVHSQGRVVFANPASAKIIGATSQVELIAKPVMEFVHPDYRESTLERIRQSLSKDILAPAMEEKFMRIDGTMVDVEVAAIPFLYDGSPAMLTVFNDITGRKQAEEALRSSEEKYRSLVNQVNDGFYVSDASGVFTFANPALARIYGFESPQAIIGRKFMDFIAPGALAELSHSARSTMHSTQAPEVINGQIVRPDGTHAFVEIKAVSVIQDGHIVGSQGVVRDVTERKRAEEKLEEERIQLRTLIDNLPDQIYIMDIQGRKIIANIADWQASGRKSMEEVIGKTDLELYPPELANAYWALDKSVIDSGTSLINREEPGIDALGKPVWLLSSKVPLRDGQGKVVGLVGIGRNITEHKEKEEEIRYRNAELEALYKFSRRLAEADDLAAVIQQVLQNAVESIHTTFAGLLLLEEAELVPYAVHPLNALGQGFILGKRQPVSFLPICQSVLEKNEPVIMRAEASEVGSAERQVLLLDFAKSVCLVPLRLGDAGQGSGTALGLLILGEARTDSREPFPPGKLSLARSIGDQAAAAIRRMLLREQAGRRLQQLASLSEIDRTIASIMDLRISLQMILRHVCERLEVDAAGVLVFNETLQSLEYAAGRGLRSQDVLGTRQRLGEGQAGKAALERQMVRIPDVAASRTVFGRQNFIKVEKVAAYFAVPLINKGKLKGVLEVYQRSPLYPNEEWLDFLNTLAGQAAIAIDNVQMFESLQRSTDELELAYDATIEGWSHALDLRDKETEGHTQRVTGQTVRLARRFGISEKDLVQVRWGALLHDIGKMGVPDGILLKPGTLTDEEWVVMKKHPGLAFEMLKPIGYLQLALDIPYCHHEKWDGTGYPRGLKGEQIPLAARIFAVVDVWDALTSDRVYRLAWSQEKARQHIRDAAGTHFDPRVVEKFFEELG